MKLKAMLVLSIASSVLAAPTGPPPGITPVHYVSPDGTHVYPFTTMETAANDIQSAVDATSAGDMVVVGDGIYDAGIRITPDYSCMNRLVITNDITVQSLNGPEFTFIVGAEATGGGLGVDAVRGAYMSAGLLSGFTVTNGHTRSYDHSEFADCAGGGVNMWIGRANVSNCVLSGNAAFFGGGCYWGTLNNCTIIDNSASDYGGGSHWTTLNHCVVSGNKASNYGGGVAFGTLNNCLVLHNSAEKKGGGVAFVSMNNCNIIDNSAIWGGGCYYGRTLNNCTITSNSAIWGGGSYGGQQGQKYNNCILYYNLAEESYDNWVGYYAQFSFSCVMPDDGGIGNITNAPLFIDPENGDYRLLATSPCIDAGDNTYVIATNDLDGNPRIIDGDMDGIATVDMGAYEFSVQEIYVEIMAPTINLRSKGRTPVAVITTEVFDATTIDPTTVRFAHAPPVKYCLEDVDEDGDVDLKLHFMTADLEINPADSEAMLICQTYDGVLVVGTDTVKVVPGKVVKFKDASKIESFTPKLTGTP